ncbi:MAG: DUF456 family protein [Bacteroidetes bacterium]|nr:DUF456 family protein [Bacteroidota bacterium]
MEWILLTLGILLLLAGIIGSFLPALPGPLLAWAGIQVCSLGGVNPGSDFLWYCTALMVVITLTDYLLPGYLVKLGKGSRKAVVGANLGVVAGLFLGIPGVIFGPFVGAWLGEMSSGKSASDAIRPATYAFLGFLSGVMIKLVYALWLLWKIILLLF